MTVRGRMESVWLAYGNRMDANGRPAGLRSAVVTGLRIEAAAAPPSPDGDSPGVFVPR